ncbi:hypothetical protein [Mycolicibacterium tusciae]|uniref:hypothetical protein n=1 Tax=Mycolicibacterium tusciae TaxID=75922 RepID=UPI00024A3F29|nr:hypothetical protein [Mycolicibacterium tusciae]
MSSIAPPPAYPTWPPQQPYPPAPQKPRRRWPAIAAAAGVGALAAGLITTLITIAVTPGTTTAAAPAPPTVTETAGPPPPPAALPAAQADAQTCHAWGTATTLVTAGTAAMKVIPDGTDITSPAVQGNPSWKSSVGRASGLFGQAADTFESQIAPGTSSSLAGVADTTVSSLRTLSEAYRSFDPASGNSVAVFRTSQQAMDWLCR